MKNNIDLRERHSANDFESSVHDVNAVNCPKLNSEVDDADDVVDLGKVQDSTLLFLRRSDLVLRQPYLADAYCSTHRQDVDFLCWDSEYKHISNSFIQLHCRLFTWIRKKMN